MLQAEHFDIERTGSGSYRLSWPRQSAPGLSVHPSASPERAIELPARIDIDATGATIAELPAAPRHFFHVRDAGGGVVAVLTDRHVPLQGARNFRDFGGYATADGRRVRWGMLYRSGQLCALTEADQRQIAALNIRLICDFRRDSERDADPNRLAPEHRPRLENLPIAPGNTANVMMHFAGGEGEVTEQGVMQTMLEINRDFALAQRPAYRRMFDALLEEDGPLLVHCAVGKDRTGFAAALILAALGVPEDTIVRDYLLTARYLPAEQEVVRFSRKYGVSLPTELMLPLLEARESYLRAALAAIDEHYGGVEAYLREYLELDEPMLAALRARLLIGA